MKVFLIHLYLWVICLGFEDKRVTRRIGKLGGDAADKEAAGLEVPVPLNAWVDVEDDLGRS